jgi:hypothetical protein
MTVREFRKRLHASMRKRLEVIRAEVLVEKIPPASEKAFRRFPKKS